MNFSLGNLFKLPLNSRKLHTLTVSSWILLHLKNIFCLSQLSYLSPAFDDLKFLPWQRLCTKHIHAHLCDDFRYLYNLPQYSPFLGIQNLLCLAFFLWKSVPMDIITAHFWKDRMENVVYHGYMDTGINTLSLSSIYFWFFFIIFFFFSNTDHSTYSSMDHFYKTKITSLGGNTDKSLFFFFLFYFLQSFGLFQTNLFSSYLNFSWYFKDKLLSFISSQSC